MPGLGIGFVSGGTGGSGIATVNDWTDLSALEPATAGTERLVTNGIPGASMSGRVLARRGATQWGVPGADSTSMAYLSAHPIPLLSPTIPWAHQVVAKNFGIQTSNNSIGTLTSAFAGASAAAMTLSRGINNKSGRSVSKVRILIPITATTGNATISMRVANMGAGSLASPAGAWAQVTWSGANTVTPANGSWSADAPKWILSDAITIPGGVPANGTLVIWEAATGGATKVVTLPDSNTSAYSSLYQSGRFASGDYASAGASGTPTWQVVDIGGFDVAIDWQFDTNADPTTLVNVFVTGDSRRAEVVPVSSSNGDGWTFKVNSLAISGLSKFRLCSGGQGGATMEQTKARFDSLIRDGILQALFDVIDYESWSWNSRHMGSGGTVATYTAILSAVKAACASASLGLIFGSVAPPGQDDPNGTIPTDLGSTDLAAYDNLTATYPASIGVGAYNAQTAVWNTSFHRRHATSASSDNVHDYIGAAGQDLVGASVYGSIPALLTSIGYAP